MRLEVLGPFTTVVTAHGDTHRIVGVPGDVLTVDEAVAAALFREVAPYIREPVAEPEAVLEAEAETVSAAVEVEMVEVPAEIAAPARTRQIKAKPAPRKKAKP